MSTFGKVLTFLNVVAAVVLLVIAGMDYAEFRAARYAAFRHELVQTGLPVDNAEISPEHPDDPIADKLTTDVVTDVFKGGDGGPDLGGATVKTVIEELDRVRRKVADNVGNAPTPEQKKKVLEGYLLMQARDVAERDKFRAMVQGGDMAGGLAELDRRFAAVKALHGATGNENWDAVRAAAAQLFVDLSRDPAWLERVRIVVGLEPLAAALDHSAHVMTQLAAGVRDAMIMDQGDFLAAYNETIGRLQSESENLYDANKRLAELKSLVANRQKEVEARRTEVERNKTELAALKGATDAEIAKLQAIQADLFAVQQRLGTALETIFKLEEQLRQRSVNGR